MTRGCEGPGTKLTHIGQVRNVLRAVRREHRSWSVPGRPSRNELTNDNGLAVCRPPVRFRNAGSAEAKPADLKRPTNFR
ncbi:hypothetical protein SBRY_110001 [Actinacidiphila bryophytorum]|uniref:Uncharacterized protein n=1 Tax=Actinacidiphila bryophytorum TaxID=1436133 RepID=A0A9W4GXY1_9ACTN|nr:hypothetical protein SBRY_110001 [Actinacidiphila bryophytorum]